MKTTARMCSLSAAFLIAGMATLCTQGAEESVLGEASAPLPKVDQVRVLDGEVIALAEGKSFTPTNSVALPYGVKVMTNLTFTVNAGRERKLMEGQILNKDGMLQSPDGSLVPVMDHITQKDGKVTLVKEGVASVLEGETKLADGSIVMADGTYIEKSGRRTRLLDGQLIKLDGAALPATDTATLTAGKVVIQKDGSQLTLRLAQSIMMADGTKILGDGTVINSDGSTAKLVEGEVLKIEGVRRR